MYVIPVILTALLLVSLRLAEWRWPARSFAVPRGWTAISTLFLAVVLPGSAAIGLLLPSTWLGEHAVFHLGSLPAPVQLLAGFLLSTFLYYWVHRAQHRFHWLWRSGHQLHHAVQRIDLAATGVVHPTDLFLQIAVSVVGCAFLLGLSPEATAGVGVMAMACGFLQHVNVRTPRWMALFCQRPEAHCRHHELGVHSYNFGDFPLWDVLFGTFSNPKDWAGEAGFGAPPPLGALMLMRDVAGPPRAVVQ